MELTRLGVLARDAEVVAAEGKGKQTCKVVGATPANLVAFNKDEAAAVRFEFPPSPKSDTISDYGWLGAIPRSYKSIRHANVSHSRKVDRK